MADSRNHVARLSMRGDTAEKPAPSRRPLLSAETSCFDLDMGLQIPVARPICPVSCKTSKTSGRRQQETGSNSCA